MNSSNTFRFFLSTILFCPMFKLWILCSGFYFKTLRATSTPCWLNLFCAKFTLSTDKRYFMHFSINPSYNLLRISFTVFTLSELWTASKIIINSSVFGYIPVRSTVSTLFPEMLSTNAWYLKRDSVFLAFIVYGLCTFDMLLDEGVYELTLARDLDKTWEDSSFFDIS